MSARAAAATGNWKLPTALSPWRGLIAVQAGHGLGIEGLVNRTGAHPIHDATGLDRGEVIAQCRLLLRLYNAGCLQPPNPETAGKTP